MKKMLSMLLALILVFSLVGCSGSSGDSGTADTGGDSSAAEESDVIKIGLYTPLTGTSALVGTQEQMGVDLAVKQLNEAGGVNGKQKSEAA